jgi:hypothetical protein
MLPVVGVTVGARSFSSDNWSLAQFLGDSSRGFIDILGRANNS